MSEDLVIAPRFCGPPGSGHGGYVCGRIAAYLDGRATVTLRRPVPLATPMTIEPDQPGSVRVLADGTLIADAATAPGVAALELPGPVPMAEARAAGVGSRLRRHPGEHPFPGCFGCGPDRAPGDGLRVLVGPVAGRSLSADVWQPDETLAGPDGYVRPEFVWAALDCAGGIAVADATLSERPHVLGRFSVRQLTPVRTGEPHVVTGWRLSEDGRKLTAGSALYTAAGQVACTARATWIRLRDPVPGGGGAVKALPSWNQREIVCL
jgi:acyl-coenzyme A thioesterase PaaI-like protein